MMNEWMLETFAQAFTPREYRAIDTWVEDVGFMLPSNTSEPGRYSIDRTPYQRGILQALSPHHPARTIVLDFGSQMGKTTVENVTMDYYIAEDPSPMIFAFSDDKNLSNYIKNKFDPMLSANPWIRELLRSEGKSSADSLTSKQFPGGFLKFLSGKSEASMRSDSVRLVIADELDAMGITKGGDPKALLAKRQNTFSETAKMCLSSTPLNDGIIVDYLEASTYRKFFVPCPHCGEKLTFEMENLHWKLVGDGIVRDAWMECPHCHGKMHNEDKLGMMEKGEWIATNPDADPTNEGFYLPSFYAPVGWISWHAIAQEYADACLTSKGVDHDRMTTFYNTILGKKYRIGGDNSQKWRSLFEKARVSELKRGEIPRWVNFLTSGADVQKDRIEVSIYGWGRLGHSLAIEHLIIPFDDEHDLEVPNSDAWQRYYDSTIGCTWEREDGLGMRTVANAIDSSYKQDCEFAFWNTLTGQDKERSFPIKGRDSLTGFTSMRRFGKQSGHTWWDVPVSSLKHHLYDHLDESMKPNKETSPYYMDFPCDYSDEYYMQLFAESWQQEKRRWIWVKTRPRNEVLDCTVYNLAMFYLMGFGNFTGDEWDAIAEEQARSAEGRGNLQRITKRGRRVLSRGFG